MIIDDNEKEYHNCWVNSAIVGAISNFGRLIVTLYDLAGVACFFSDFFLSYFMSEVGCFNNILKTQSSTCWFAAFSLIFQFFTIPNLVIIVFSEFMSFTYFKGPFPFYSILEIFNEQIIDTDSPKIHQIVVTIFFAISILYLIALLVNVVSYNGFFNVTIFILAIVLPVTHYLSLFICFMIRLIKVIAHDEDSNHPYVQSMIKTKKAVKSLFKKLKELSIDEIWPLFKLLLFIIEIAFAIIFCCTEGSRSDSPATAKNLVGMFFYLFFLGGLGATLSLSWKDAGLWSCDSDGPNCENLASSKVKESSIAVNFIFIAATSLLIVFSGLASGKDKIPDYTGSTEVTSSYKARSMSTDDPKWTLKDNPICTMNAYGLNIIQHLSLIAMSYYQKWSKDKDVSGERWMLETLYNLTGYTYNQENVLYNNKGAGQILAIRIPEKSLTVFSVRGTYKTKDFLADAELWAPSAILNIAFAFMPFAKTYSELTRNALVTLVSVPRFFFAPFSILYYYVDSMNSFITDIRNERPDDNFIVSGHSYGGGVAKILSLKQNIPGVSLSGPGISVVAKYFVKQSNNNDLINFVDIAPDMDLIAMVDYHEGTEYQIPCNVGAFMCHDKIRSICQAASMCQHIISTENKNLDLLCQDYQSELIK